MIKLFEACNKKSKIVFHMKKTFGENVIDFNKNLHYSGTLPDNFRVLNPYMDNPETMKVMKEFYQSFYDDNDERKFLIGINPSRHWAGVTGVPFTDTKRLESACNIRMQSARTHEVSSVFMYDMIEQFGGAQKFYKEFYINSPFPLAIVRKTWEWKWLNANYYDDSNLFSAVKEFMIWSLRAHIDLGLDTREVYVLGKKNADFIQKLNKEALLFWEIITLDHPRYIQQYKFHERMWYIQKYLQVLNKEKNES